MSFRKGYTPWNKGSTFIKRRVILCCGNCGKNYQVIPAKVNSSKFCSKQCHGAYRGKLNIGENNGRWQGGVSELNFKARHGYLTKRLRKVVLLRDEHKCVLCSSTTSLEVDHIKSFALYPDLRFNINNCRTLCKICHMATDNWGNKKYVIKN